MSIRSQSIDVLPTVTTLPRAKYPQEFREWCFMLWATDCNRNISAVVQRVSERGHQETDPFAPTTVSQAAISFWKKEERWNERLVSDFLKTHRHHYDTAIAHIGLATEKAIATLMEVMDDPAAHPMARVQAANSILAKAGHMDHRANKDDSKPDGPAKIYTLSAAGKSTQELAALVQDRARAAIENASSDLIDVEVASD